MENSNAPATPAAPAAPAASSSTPSAPASTAPSTVETLKNMGSEASKLPPDAPEAPAEGVVAEKKSRRLKIKVDGQEEELDLDAMSDEELTRQIQLARASHKRMQEAAAVRKQFQQFGEAITADPFEAVQSTFGVDLKELAVKKLMEQYEDELLPPEQKRQRELERELEKYKQAEAKRAEEEKRRAEETLQKQIYEETTRQFNAAIEAAGLPRTQKTLQMMAEIARNNLEYGIELSPQQLALAAKEYLTENVKQTYHGLKGAELVQFLGDDVVKEVLRHSVAEAKKRQQPTGAVPAAPPPAAPSDDDDESERYQFGNYRRKFKGNQYISEAEYKKKYR